MDPFPDEPEPPPMKQNRLSPLNISPLIHNVLPKKFRPSTPESLLYANKLKLQDQPNLGRSRKTSPAIWCGAILCMVFSLLLIFFALTILIIYVIVKPKTPIFDTPAAGLSTINITSQQFVNSDFTFLANFSNPNWKMNVRFEYLLFQFYFHETLFASEYLQPFGMNPGDVRVIPVHLPLNSLYLPENIAMELQKQEVNNRVVFSVKGNFKVRVGLGSVHRSYWLHANCEMQMTSPPTGMLITHTCKTKR